MVNTLFTFTRPLALAAITLGASLTSAQAEAVSPHHTGSQNQQPIILAQAQPKNNPQNSNEPWAIQCGEDETSGKKFCRMQQSLRYKKTGQRLLAVIIQPQTIEPKLAILISLPHGLYLPAGTAYKIDGGEENRMVIETCDAEGCYASSGISDKMVEIMKKGEKMLIGFQASNKKPITIPITLKGFTAAFDKITKGK